MTIRTVTTQTELDQAIADGVTDIVIRSEPGVWLEASGSATVSASDSATVSASDSATVYAFGSVTVYASGSVTVRAFGSVTVYASDSATVSASGSATVRAFGSVTVYASDSATVYAFGSATVSAGTHVAVHLHSGHATIDGGVLIDHATIDLTDAAVWCAYHGVAVSDGHATLYKAVRDDLRSAHGTAYPVGETVACDDWADDGECGHGLHLSPHPSLARDYDAEATRYLECSVSITDLRPLNGPGAAKCKTPRLVVMREVDEWCRRITTAAQEVAR
jgi:hypothetical protein